MQHMAIYDLTKFNVFSINIGSGFCRNLAHCVSFIMLQIQAL